MAIERVLLVGASGHGKVVFDALIESGVSSMRITVADDNFQLADNDFLGVKVKFPAITPEGKLDCLFHVAVGDGSIRQNIFERLLSAGARPLTIVHPSASVSRFSSVGAGAFVAARAVIGPSAAVGVASIVNHAAVVDHDCSVGGFTHIAPNAVLGGGVRVGSRVLVGAGAVVLPGCSIGDDTVVGAGAVVLCDIPSNAVWVGVPAAEVSGRECD